MVPVFLILAGLVVNLLVLGWVGFGYVVKEVYLKDVRYDEWRKRHWGNFVGIMAGLALLGPRSHKLFYSKLFGL